MKKQSLTELGRISEAEYKSADKIGLEVVLDNIRSAYNVGSFFRSADAFRIAKIHLCGITARPPHKEILKTAIGAEDTVEWEYHEDIIACISSLKEKGNIIVGIEQTDKSVPLQDVTIDSGASYALVFGNEVDGISTEILPLLDYAVEIPQFGTKHSFNVSVCGGIVMWEYARVMWDLNR